MEVVKTINYGQCSFVAGYLVMSFVPGNKNTYTCVEWWTYIHRYMYWNCFVFEPLLRHLLLHVLHTYILYSAVLTTSFQLVHSQECLVWEPLPHRHCWYHTLSESNTKHATWGMKNETHDMRIEHTYSIHQWSHFRVIGEHLFNYKVLKCTYTPITVRTYVYTGTQHAVFTMQILHW